MKRLIAAITAVFLGAALLVGPSVEPAAASNPAPAESICKFFRTALVPFIDGRISIVVRWTDFNLFGHLGVGCTFWDGQFADPDYVCMIYDRQTNQHWIPTPCPTPP